MRNSFLNVAPERLLKSFSRRLGCLHDSPEAQALVRDWLGADGWLSEIGNLNAFGMALFENVAPVDPDAVLKSIQAAAERRPDFFELNSNRADLVRLLRSLAYEATSFDQAVDLVAQFARSKTESNNLDGATNVFKSMFYLFLSGTHASAKQRCAFLRKLAGANRSEDRALVLAALDAMLECGHFHRATPLNSVRAGATTVSIRGLGQNRRTGIAAHCRSLWNCPRCPIFARVFVQW